MIHRLTYRRTNRTNIHVRGYQEEGTTTTPFDMVMMNDLDRFHLVTDVIDRVPSLRGRMARLRQEMVDARVRARLHPGPRRGRTRDLRLDLAPRGAVGACVSSSSTRARAR
jgi:XFP C-terminal domain